MEATEEDGANIAENDDDSAASPCPSSPPPRCFKVEGLVASSNNWPKFDGNDGDDMLVLLFAANIVAGECSGTDTCSG